MRVVELIRKKRNGESLTRTETEFILDGYIRGEIPDYQVAAWLMAVYFKGMSEEEMVGLTLAIMESGVTLDLSGLPGPSVDKHSSGGVGDKVSLPLAPMLAACGLYVPMLSGRGLGHTGGTLDKLESIPGFRTVMPEKEVVELVSAHGLAIVGQSEALAPADRKLYALRDVTATVESIPLIVGSILGKKLAAGPEFLVFDVKTGSGAFMSTFPQAEDLATKLVRVANGAGRKAAALVTGMDEPLGIASGNAPEVAESIAALRGEGPDDLLEVTMALGIELLLLAGAAASEEGARDRLAGTIDSGRALEKFAEMVEAQGGDPRVIDHPGLLPRWRHEAVIEAPRAGYVERIATLEVGQAIVSAGAGRNRVTDPVDYSCGLKLECKTGDRVAGGEVIGTIGGASAARVDAAAARIKAAITVADQPVEAGGGRILAKVTGGGTEDYRTG